MANLRFPLGKHAINTKNVSVTADTLKATALSMASTAGKIALVTNATNATPIVVSAAGSYSAGDIVVCGGIGGNLAANGTWQVGAVGGGTVSLLTKLDGNNSTGSGAYTSGGYIINVSTASALTDVSGNSLGTDVTLASVTDTGGVVNAASWTWTSMPATKVNAVVIYDSTSNNLLAWLDGYDQVYVCDQAAASATKIVTERLAFQIPAGTTLYFSDGASATLTAQANVGDTSLTVSALAAIVHRQATADAVELGAGFGLVPGTNGSFIFTPDTNVNKLWAS